MSPTHKDELIKAKRYTRLREMEMKLGMYRSIPANASITPIMGKS